MSRGARKRGNSFPDAHVQEF